MVAGSIAVSLAPHRVGLSIPQHWQQSAGVAGVQSVPLSGLPEAAQVAHCTEQVVAGDMCNLVIYLLHRLEEDVPNSVTDHPSYREAVESMLRDVVSDTTSSIVSRQHLHSLALLRPISSQPVRSWLTRHRLTEGSLLEDSLVTVFVRGAEYLLKCGLQSNCAPISSRAIVPHDFNVEGFAQFLGFEEIAFGVLLGLRQCDSDALSKIDAEAKITLLRFIFVFVSVPVGIVTLHRLAPVFRKALNESPSSMHRLVWAAENAADRGVCNCALDILLDALSHGCTQQHVQVALVSELVPRLSRLSRRQPGGCAQVPRIFFALLHQGRGPVLEELLRSRVVTRHALFTLLRGSVPVPGVQVPQLAPGTLDEPLALLAVEAIVEMGFPGEFCPEFVSQLPVSHGV